MHRRIVQTSLILALSVICCRPALAACGDKGGPGYRNPELYVSTSYVERQNLSLRMGSRRFTRLSNGFSKKLENHIAAVALYVCHYNLCRTHEALRTTPAKALGVADRAWSIGQLVDAALSVAPALPTET